MANMSWPQTRGHGLRMGHSLGDASGNQLKTAVLYKWVAHDSPPVVIFLLVTIGQIRLKLLSLNARRPAPEAWTRSGQVFSATCSKIFHVQSGLKLYQRPHLFISSLNLLYSLSESELTQVKNHFCYVHFDFFIRPSKFIFIIISSLFNSVFIINDWIRQG